MRKILVVFLMSVLSLMLVSCKNSSNYNFKAEGHNLDDFVEVEVNYDELTNILTSLNFNYDKPRLSYFFQKYISKDYYSDKLVRTITNIRKENMVYTLNETERYATTFAGDMFYEYNSGSTDLSYDTKIIFDGENYGFDFKKVKPTENSTIKTKGKYQTTVAEGFFTKANDEKNDIEYRISSFIEYSNSTTKHNYKVYKDNKGNFLIREDIETIIWSLRYDSDYNVVSFYSKSNDELINITEDQKTQSSIDYEHYIIFDTKEDYKFNFDNFNKVDYIKI